MKKRQSCNPALKVEETLSVFADIARFGGGQGSHTDGAGHWSHERQSATMAQSGLIKHMVDGHTLDIVHIHGHHTYGQSPSFTLACLTESHLCNTYFLKF